MRGFLAISMVCCGVVMGCVCSGCDTTRNSSQQLSRVAKDWCLNIRASQVIPVYPLSEDVEVGDVYLVRTRLEDQVKVYEDEGFLPLENLVARLPVSGYTEFYRGGYLVADDSSPPRHWQFPKSVSTTTGPATQPTTQPTLYSSAPRAAFPTYGFQVSRGEGASVAVPVQGIPVGLSLLNAASGSGTVAITEAYTYGLGLETLQQQAKTWAAIHRDFLQQFEPQRDPKTGSMRSHYLRVVNRVYLAGRMDVSLAADQVKGAEGRAGGGGSLTLPTASRGDPAASLQSLNEQLAKATPPTPGASLKATAASARTIALSESFSRPLVIGYLGFDLEVLPNGELGPPVPTQQRLERPGTQLPAKAVTFGPDPTTELISKFIDTDVANNKKVVADWLAAHGREGLSITHFLYAAPYRDLRSAFAVEQNLTPRQ